MRVTDQYFWNIIFSAFFIALITSGTIILESVPTTSLHDVSPFTFFILALATFRLTRLFVYDKITAFFREQFYDAKVLKTGIILEKPKNGPRRALADLLSCPWCFGMWAAAMVVFFFEISTYAWYPILMLALSAVGTLFQILSNLIGWKAEQLKKETETL